MATKKHMVQNWVMEQENGHRFMTSEITAKVNSTPRELSAILKDISEVTVVDEGNRGGKIWEVKL
jgi:hypothetical protein